MIASCPTHGEVEYHVDKNENAWCPKCRSENFKASLASDEGKAKLSHAVIDHIRSQPPRSFVTVDGDRVWAPIDMFPTFEQPNPHGNGYPSIGEIIDEGSKSNDEVWAGVAEHLKQVGAVTCHKPGTPGYVPPPPRPFGETAGFEPPYQETYFRPVRVDEGSNEDGPA